MNMHTLVAIIIWLLIAGFVFWALRRIAGLISMDPLFKNIVDLVIIIVAIGIILFQVIIPLLNMVAGVNLSLH